jgi:hypothetical protein
MLDLDGRQHCYWGWNRFITITLFTMECELVIDLKNALFFTITSTGRGMSITLWQFLENML